MRYNELKNPKSNFNILKGVYGGRMGLWSKSSQTINPRSACAGLYSLE